MLILYYWPGTSSVVPHIVLEEIGAPYERQLVNLAQGEHKSVAYLKINPRGKVPALAIDGNVLAENVVIADAQSRGNLLVFEILGRVTDDATRMKLIVCADHRHARKIDVGSNDAMRSHVHTLVDDGIGSDFDGRIQLRSRVHNGSGVDHGADPRMPSPGCHCSARR